MLSTILHTPRWLGVLALMFIANLASAATITVMPGDPIQDILDSTSDGDVVDFSTGTYQTGEIIVRKSITLHGEGSTLIGQITVNSDNVTINDFSIEHSGDVQYGIWIKSSASGTNVRNNTIQGFHVGIGLGGHNSNIDSNSLSNNEWGIYSTELIGNASVSTINSNTIQNSGIGAIGLVNNTTTTMNVQIVNNSLSQNGSGIRLTNADSVQITGNIISDSSSGANNAAIELLGATGNITVEGNRLEDGNYGIQIRNSNSNIEIHKNQIVDFDTAGMFVQQNPVGSTTYATCNYWGDDSGPFNASTNPTGTGNAVTGDAEVAAAIYTPWTITGGLCSGTPGPGPTPPTPGLSGIWQERHGNRCIQIPENDKVAETYKKCGPLTCHRSVGVLRLLTDDEPWIARILYPGMGLVSQEIAPLRKNRILVRDEYHYGPIQYSKRHIYRKVDRCRFQIHIPIPKPHPKPKPPTPAPTPSVVAAM